jgi:hypothetical protein
MIKSEIQSSVICDTCKEEAWRRTVTVSYGEKGSRQVSYDTHNADLAESGHIAAWKRLDKFHEKLYALQSACKAFTQEDRRLLHGTIIDFEFETVHPDACSRRTQFIAVATIRVAGLGGTVRLPARKLAGQTAEKILAEIKKAATPEIERLIYIFENRDF